MTVWCTQKWADIGAVSRGTMPCNKQTALYPLQWLFKTRCVKRHAVTHSQFKTRCVKRHAVTHSQFKTRCVKRHAVTHSQFKTRCEKRHAVTYSHTQATRAQWVCCSCTTSNLSKGHLNVSMRGTLVTSTSACGVPW